MAAQESLSELPVFWITALASEDSETEIRDRVRAAGGNLDCLRIVGLNRDEGVEALPLLLSCEGSKLLIIDPLQAAIGDLGSIKARDLMEDLVGFARSTSTTCVCIRHINKSGSARGRGELADVARAEIYLGHHPEDPDLYVAAPAPSSYGEGEPIAFRITQMHGTPALVHVAEGWDDNIHYMDLIPTPPRRRRARRVTTRERAKNWLIDLLAGGPMSREEVLALGRRRRLRERTIERAANDLGVQRQSRRQSGRIISALWSLGIEIGEEATPSGPPLAWPTGPTAAGREPQSEGAAPRSPSANNNGDTPSPELSRNDQDPGFIRFQGLDLADVAPKPEESEPDDDCSGFARFGLLDLD
tara:strand:+ start:917 stop:1993 length:1077 start_codon:yes stop_codon:yes gene_type:complete